MSNDERCDAIPTLGHLIVRRKAPDKTAGGIELTGALKDEAARFFVVSASEGYMDGGQLVRMDLQPGDEVVMAANGRATMRLKDGREVTQGVIQHVAAPDGLLPPDCVIVLMQHVASSVPRALVKPVLGSGAKVEVASALSLVKH